MIFGDKKYTLRATVSAAGLHDVKQAIWQILRIVHVIVYYIGTFEILAMKWKNEKFQCETSSLATIGVLKIIWNKNNLVMHI